MKSLHIKKLSKISVVLAFTLSCLCLQGCAQDVLTAPCDNYGNHCDPKIKINQWTPN